ncbi:DinB family protein [Cyclobacterium sp. SYSU L10401]|uniref:DinB family protein n=1 Tax=Cyclobacterium sp. SYSU L10401 TaxID=2678657 RepID=UPI0013D10373|nr:DinB family protein [Cyclobacterium sp. SYSU L10401]
MQVECQENLKSISALLKSLNEDQYQYPSTYLSGATIGQHIRHIIEFYTCLTNACIENTPVNYDARKRDTLLERNPLQAIKAIDRIIDYLESQKILGNTALLANYTVGESEICSIPSSFQRELAYCLEHSIHHQALIKIGLLEQGLPELICPDFGVAPSTIKFRMANDS